ncbi:MAG TPA: FAD-dependent oxidoreductase [Candidatus Saccharimonadales bacterium]|nr:FAD-dependent oxidoreductase [Candidatus Saccharimonadales bacterium]
MTGNETGYYEPSPLPPSHNGEVNEIPPPTPDHILIIGCGIAGLATAICLKRAGIEATIFESHPTTRDSSGAFFGLHPNGRDVLKTLGVADTALAEGIATREFHFSNNKRSLTTVATDVITIRRGAVARALREEVISQGTSIRYGKQLTAITQTNDRVMATFEDGTHANGACLIGSDGIHSKTRRIIFGDSPRPYYTGMVRSATVIKNTLGLKPSYGTTNMIIGREAFFSYLVRPDDLIYWFSNRFDKAAPSQGEIEAISQADWQAELMSLYDGDNPIIGRIIAATDDTIQKYPVYDMPLIADWHKQRVCLIGDAAHAPSPKAGQGASMALEDAITIAKCLRDIPDIRQAFATFESLRKQRVETLFKKTRESAGNKTPRTAVGRFVADLLLPINLKIAGRTTRSMYDYHIDWNEPVKTATGR